MHLIIQYSLCVFILVLGLRLEMILNCEFVSPLHAPSVGGIFSLVMACSVQLRLMQSEQTVEAVVRERSLKVFKERCWQAYQPPDL